jgi:hypothetical protein
MSRKITETSLILLLTEVFFGGGGGTEKGPFLVLPILLYLILIASYEIFRG